MEDGALINKLLSLSSLFLISFCCIAASAFVASFATNIKAQTIDSNEFEISSINQTLLSLIPLMIQEVENTNATDIPIKQVMEATPSNITELQNILNNKTSQNSQNTNSTTSPKDLIPMMVNITENTNATDIPINRVIDSVPNNITELQNILNNKTSQNSQNTNSTTSPKDLIPMMVNITENTNATDIGIMRIINATPDISSFK